MGDCRAFVEYQPSLRALRDQDGKWTSINGKAYFTDDATESVWSKYKEAWDRANELAWQIDALGDEISNPDPSRGAANPSWRGFRGVFAVLVRVCWVGRVILARKLSLDRPDYRTVCAGHCRGGGGRHRTKKEGDS